MKSFNKSFSFPGLLSLFIVMIVIYSASFRFSELYAQQDANCEEKLSEADLHYKAGNWQDAIELIKQCLVQRDLDEAEKGRAYRLLGLVYIAIELEKEANDAVKNLLIMVPNYKINPDTDPPQLKRLIDDVSQKMNPAISNISPDNVDVESDPVTLTVTGSDFVYGSVVRFNGEDKVTTYVNQNQLTALIPKLDLVNDGEYDISVFSPIHDGKISNAMKFKVNPSSNMLTWLLVGGGAAVAAVITVIALGGGDEDDGNPPGTGSFPEPPSR
jgi:tetratricopeptide (TPR) repeat protein